MTQTINLTDKFAKGESSYIQIKSKKYAINNSVEAVLGFEELAAGASVKGLVHAIKGALGDAAFEEIGVAQLSLANLKVLMAGIVAAMQGVSYEEAAARFQQQQPAAQ